MVCSMSLMVKAKTPVKFKKIKYSEIRKSLSSPKVKFVVALELKFTPKFTYLQNRVTMPVCVSGKSRRSKSTLICSYEERGCIFQKYRMKFWLYKKSRELVTIPVGPVFHF